MLFPTLRPEASVNRGTIHTQTAERVEDIFTLLGHGQVPAGYPAQFQANLTEVCVRKFPGRGDCANCSFPLKAGLQKYVDWITLRGELEAFVDGGGKSIFLSGGGEPGEYENLPEFLAFLADDPRGQKLELTFNTNGTFCVALRKLADGADGDVWRDRLRRIFSGERGGREVLSMVSLSWHEDQASAHALRVLSGLREDLGLKLAIRVSSLVYMDPALSSNPLVVGKGTVGGRPFTMTTRPDQVDRVIELARENGADIISFKPAHTLSEAGTRVFVTNDPVYVKVLLLAQEQQNAADMLGWNWAECDGRPDFGLFFEESPRLNRLTTKWHEACRTFLTRVPPMCFAPLAVVFQGPRGMAACCDTWASGLGGAKPMITGWDMPQPPAFYLYNLFHMVTAIGEYAPRNCLPGCGWQELNLMNPIAKWGRDLAVRYGTGMITLEEVWAEILDYFGKDLDQRGLPRPPMPELNRFTLLAELKKSA